MPLIKWLEKPKNSKIKLVAFGLFLVALSFLVLNLTNWAGILIIGILFMTIGEMIAFPFSNAFAVERSKKGRAGQYMAMYAIAFSLSHIFSHNAGMQIIYQFGYEIAWYLITIFALIGVLILLLLKHLLNKEKEAHLKGLKNKKNIAA